MSKNALPICHSILTHTSRRLNATDWDPSGPGQSFEQAKMAAVNARTVQTPHPYRMNIPGPLFILCKPRGAGETGTSDKGAEAERDIPLDARRMPPLAAASATLAATASM